MGHLPINVLLYGLLVVTTITVMLYGIYAIVRSLYQDFLDFSRRFRGVE
jgi:hypothetical protein